MGLILNCFNQRAGLILDRCTSDELDDGSKYLAAFIVAMVLQGFGAVPLHVLGVTYIDDASPPGTASVHIGIYKYIYLS